ncbi:MAG: FecR domain-containing protein [Sphingobium sp.]
MADPREDRMKEEAIAWHLRLVQGSGDDWERFVDWLEIDPRHNDIYQAVAEADADLDGLADLLPTSALPVLENTDHGAMEYGHQRSRIGKWRARAIAASVVLAVGGAWISYNHVDGRYSVTTRPGEMRKLALTDGTRIALNGSTELVLDRDDPRQVELKSGEALFTVRHDKARPFTLTVGENQIVDVGTVFNVLKNNRALRVEVAEGAVRYVDGPVSHRLNAGDTLSIYGNEVIEGHLPDTAIGSWAEGKLVYRDRPLIEVVGDISRAKGVAIELGPDLSLHKFTGVIQLTGDDETVRRRFEQLLGLRVTGTSDGWSISQ